MKPIRVTRTVVPPPEKKKLNHKIVQARFKDYLNMNPETFVLVAEFYETGELNAESALAFEAVMAMGADDE